MTIGFWWLHLRRLLVIALVLGPFCPLVFVSADDPSVAGPISVSAGVKPEGITIGDIVTYSVVVRHDPDIQPSMPQFKEIEGFDFIERGVLKPRKVDGQVEQEFWVRLRADQVGSHTFPAITVPFKAPETKGGKMIPGKILAPEVLAEVQSVLRLQGETNDIRDIKPLLEVGRDWTFFILLGLTGILLILLGIFLWKKLRKDPLHRQPQSPPDLSPHDLAFQELKALKARDLLKQGLIREHYFQLSEIFRRFMGTHYGIPALDWTTEEISEALSQLPALREKQRKQACTILKITDQVKFAKAKIPPDRDEIDEIGAFVKATREPVIKPQTSPTPTPGL